jgi:hypothetical protein
MTEPVVATMAETGKGAAGDLLTAPPVAPGGDWDCPCGQEKSRRAGGSTPVRTIVALREHKCPFCGRAFRPEYRR